LDARTRKAILLFVVLFVTWQLLYSLGLDTLLGYAIVLAVVVVFLALDKQSLAKVGLRRPSGWTGYVVIGCVLAVIFVTYLFVVGSVLYSNVPPSLSRPEIFSVGAGVLSVPYLLVLALTIGLVEETSFRGYILRNLRGSFSARKAVLYSAILFGLYHISFYYIYTTPLPPSQSFTYWSSFILYTFVGGVFLGYFYLNTGRTIVGTLAYHSSNIFIQSFVPYPLAFSFTEGHLLSTIPIILFIPLLFLLKRTRRLGKSNAIESDKELGSGMNRVRVDE
jgi:membrane protease YdiL (CAAX protease family)